MSRPTQSPLLGNHKRCPSGSQPLEPPLVYQNVTTELSKLVY